MPFEGIVLLERLGEVRGMQVMTEESVRLGPREQQIAELLLQGCDNTEIARQLNMARRTVKAHFNRLFMRFGITGGIKRVKLAILLYRRQVCSEERGTESVSPVNESSKSSNLSLRDLRTVKSQMRSEPQSTLSKTTCVSSTTSLDSGTGLNLPSGTKLAGTNRPPTPDVLESWERRLLDADPAELASRSRIEN